MGTVELSDDDDDASAPPGVGDSVDNTATMKTLKHFETPGGDCAA